MAACTVNDGLDHVRIHDNVYTHGLRHGVGLRKDELYLGADIPSYADKYAVHAGYELKNAIMSIISNYDKIYGISQQYVVLYRYIGANDLFVHIWSDTDAFKP